MKVSGCLRAVPRRVSAASLQPRLARPYTQTLLSAATAGAIQAIAEETSLSPGSRTTVGLRSRCSAGEPVAAHVDELAGHG
jgi:hypothetical protein